MSNITLNLVVLRSPDVARAAAFYTRLGLPKRYQFGDAALRGVRYALDHSEPPVDLSVTGVRITAIEDFPVDTTPTAVEFAACYATWEGHGSQANPRATV
jgi:catechol 2,3-dioxygenase-like lactoylglutathione lyase family enzyme